MGNEQLIDINGFLIKCGGNNINVVGRKLTL